MGLNDIIRDALHTKNLDVKTRPVGQSVIDLAQLLLVNLAHVNREASSRVQPPPTSFALEVFRFLV